MTALLYEDVVAAPVPAPPPTPARKRVRAVRREPFVGGDPLVDAATRLLSIPLHQVYAVLWRIGLIEVTA